MDFAAALATVAGNPPRNENGWVTTLDLSSAVDYISDENRIVVNNANTFDLEANMVRRVWYAQGCPNVSTVVTADHLAAAMKPIGRVISMHTTLALFRHTDVAGALTYRANDIVTHAEYERDTLAPDVAAAVIAGKMHACIDAVRRLYAYLCLNPVAMAKACEDAPMVLMMLFANAMHRELVDNHNWLTGNTNTAGTPTARCLGVAGEQRMLLKAFALLIGHDLWHFLDNATLRRLALIGVGEIFARVVAVAPDVVFVYNGMDVAGQLVHIVLKTPASVSDRFPIGTIGIAGLITGIEMILSAFNEISMKAAITGWPPLSHALVSLSEVLGNSRRRITRPDLILVRDHLRGLVSFAVGYMNCTRAGKERLENLPSLMSYVKNSEVEKAAGDSCYRMMETIGASSAAIGTMLEANMTNLSMALADIQTTVYVAHAGLAPVPFVNLPVVIEVKVNKTRDELRHEEDILRMQAKP